MVLVLKGGNLSELAISYRPLYLVEAISKLVGNLIRGRLVRELEAKGRLHERNTVSSYLVNFLVNYLSGTRIEIGKN